MNTAVTPENGMRLLKDCTIVKVDDQFGPGIQVWNNTGMLYLGRFQSVGMKINGIGKRPGEANHHGADRLVIFTDEEHQDASWDVFRETMLHQRRVYIPDDFHTPESERGAFNSAFLSVNRWLPIAIYWMWVFIPFMLWLTETPLNFLTALSGTILAILAIRSHLALRKGEV